MQTLIPIHQPSTAEDCYDKNGIHGWASRVRGAILADNQSIHAGHDKSIMAQSVHTGLYQRIMLPGGSTQFATKADRDKVHAMLCGKTGIPNIEE